MNVRDLSEPSCHFWHAIAIHRREEEWPPFSYDTYYARWLITGNAADLDGMETTIRYQPGKPPDKFLGAVDGHYGGYVEWMLADDWRDDEVFGRKGERDK